MQAKFGDYVLISGILPKDAEYQLTRAKGVPLCKFGVKVGEKINGENREAIWANCVCWRDVAKTAALFNKGDTIFAIGTLQTSTFTGRDGEERSKTELVCEFAIKMPTVGTPVSAMPASTPDGFTELPDISEDELPF